jgi:hypothetical protein
VLPTLTLDSSPNFIGVAGIAYDIFGAIILANGIVFVRSKSILHQAVSYVGFSPALVKLHSEQKADGVVGLLLLICGFILQGLSTYGFNSNLEGLLALLTILVISLAFYFLGRRALVKRLFTGALRTHRSIDEPNGFTDARIQQIWNDVTGS